MPCSHLDTYSGHAIMDREGIVLSVSRAARRRAIRLCAAAIESDFAQLRLCEEWRIDVTDNQGHLQLLHLAVPGFETACDLAKHRGAAT